jgi:hypothetical protein
MKKLMMMLVVFVLITPSTSLANEEDELKQITDVVQPFLKAMKDKDIDAAMKYASTPWLTGNEKTIKERDELKKHIQEQMKTFDAKRWGGEVKSVVKYGQFKKDADPVKQKKFIEFADKLIQEADFVVVMADKETVTVSYLLMRKQKEKVTIASGPHRLTYLMIDNRIPEEILMVLDNAQEIELYSLDPKDIGKAKELGKTVIKNADVRKKLVAEFKSGVEDSIGLAALCFNPRHRLKAKYKDKVIDLVICFECLQVQYSLDGKETRTLLISSKPQALFDNILKDAGVELAPKPKE